MSCISSYFYLPPLTEDRPEDSEYEVACMSEGVGELDVYPSIWGHWAGGPPGNMEDVKWLDDRLRKIFSSAPKRN